MSSQGTSSGCNKKSVSVSPLFCPIGRVRPSECQLEQNGAYCLGSEGNSTSEFLKISDWLKEFLSLSLSSSLSVFYSIFLFPSLLLSFLFLSIFLFPVLSLSLLSLYSVRKKNVQETDSFSEIQYDLGDMDTSLLSNTV